MLLAPTDVHRLIESAVSLLRRSVDPSVLISTELLAPRAIVLADPSLLQNAILNLLVNARDAMDSGGRLDIVTASRELDSNSQGLGQGLPHGPYMLLEVRDTGSGISAEALPKIFDPFFTTKALGKGTGLGLAAVAGTAKALGGSISAETQLGRGSVFRLLLPLARAEPESKSGEVASPTRGAGEILVVDDEHLVRGTVAATLRSLGYGVTTVADGAAAIELVRAKIDRFDLVLLDLRMPKLSGAATFDALMEVNSQLRVLIWSGHGAEQDLEDMLRRGAVGFVQKPYRVADLARAVADAMARPAQ